MNEFLLLKRRFRILKHWRILLVKSKKYSGFSSIGDRKAIVYDWTDDKPKDFNLHELLHCALRELINMDRRRIKKLIQVEEELIQDICNIFMEKE